MKVALVCDWFHPRLGGIELHLQDLATRLGAAGHDVVVITPTPGSDAVDGVRVVRIHAARAPRFGFLVTPGGVRAIGDALVREAADVAHCHVSIVSPAALGGAGQAVARGIPTVLTFHSIVPRTDLLAGAMARALGTGQWAARFSAVSERVRREVAPIARGAPMSLLSNGIDAGYWRGVVPTSRDTETLELVTVMRLNPKKRPLAFVEMMERVRGLLPSSQRLRLRVVGDGPERTRMEREVARRGLSGVITLLGRRSRDEIRAVFASSDIFVLPTVRESFGLAALEARCAGLPVVAMGESGVSEFIRHGSEGLLAATDAELAALVATLARDSGKRARIAAHNRDTPAGFDWPLVVASHVSIYREAIALRDNV